MTLDGPQAEAALALLPPLVRAWLDAEQSRVTREVDPRRLVPGDARAVPEAFRPEAGRVFHLETRWAPRARVRLVDPGVASGPVRRLLLRPGAALVVLHPAAAHLAPAWLRRCPAGPALYAAATASTRTVLAWGDHGAPVLFLKLSLPLEVSGMDRALGEAEAASSVGLTPLLRAATRAAPGGLDFLPETLAVVPRGTAVPLACLARELPPPVLRGDASLVPWFALTHPSRQGAPPLLEAWARRAGQAPLEFFRGRLLEPFLRAFLVSALEQGWSCDAHAQNLLVELGRNGAPTGRFAVRDLDGAWPDLGFLEDARRVAAPPLRAARRVAGRGLDDAQLELQDALEQALHTYFLGGPVWHLGRRHGQAPARRLFERALSRAARAVALGPVPDLRTAEDFAQWVLDERARRGAPPRVPGGVRAWLHLEQAWNDRARHPRLFPKVDLGALPSRFDPAAAPVFRLEWLEVPARALEVRRALRAPSPALRRALVAGPGRLRFFLHPFMREAHRLDALDFPLRRGSFWATPTASARTLVAWREAQPGSAFALKLSVDLEVQRIRRVVKASKLARAVALTDALDAAALRGAGFRVLREPLALRLRWSEHGTVFRELPRGEARLVPGFALFAAPPGGGLPLALRLAGTPRGAERVARFCEERLFAPLTRAAAWLMLREGLAGDLHQQNVLFERGPRGALTGRLVLRDLDAFKADVDLRARRGLTLRPWLRQRASAEDLKLDQGGRHYDEAWGREVRAEWAWLGARLLGEHAGVLGGPAAVGAALARHRFLAAFDRLLLAEAARHLGEEVVWDELDALLRARGSRAARAARQGLAAARRAGRPAAEVARALPASLLVDPRDPLTPLYSVNAMVHAWRRAHRSRAPAQVRRLLARR